MEPFEIMVSESQERMLAVVEPGQGRRGPRPLREVGDRIRGDRRDHRLRRPSGCCATARWSARCRWRRWSMTARCMTWNRRSRATWPYAGVAARRSALGAREQDDAGESALGACSPRPSVASKRWAFEQYDSVVGSHTVRRPESADAAVLHLHEAGATIAVSIDGNGRRVACDPYAGTVEAVLECAQNLACVGAAPLGLTNCLNFGNPEKPTVAWQLDRSTQGLADACDALGGPGGRRKRLALQRDRPGPDLPDPGGRHGRRASRPRTRRRARAQRRATRSRSAARSRPRSPARSSRSCAASSGPGCPRSRSTRSLPRSKRCARRCAKARCAPPTTSATAGSPARWPRSRSPAASESTPTSTRWSRLRGCSGETALFGEGPGRLRAHRRPRPARGTGSRWRRLVRGRRGGRRPDHALGRGRGGRRRPRRRRARLALAR